MVSLSIIWKASFENLLLKEKSILLLRCLRYLLTGYFCLRVILILLRWAFTLDNLLCLSIHYIVF